MDVTQKQLSVLETEEDSVASLLLCPHAPSALRCLTKSEELRSGALEIALHGMADTSRQL